jgi:DNA repair exonuclease SbcCD ATPase subunit
LEQQINTIKKTSETRLESLKKEVVSVETELEEVRYEASFAGVQSTKEHKKQLSEKQTKLKQIKEKTESMEQLEQKVVAGLAHISDILFIPKSEEDAPVVNLIRDIEAVLDTLINEREKQLQQQQGGAGGPGNTSALSLGGGLGSANGMRDSLSTMVSPHMHI